METTELELQSPEAERALIDWHGWQIPNVGAIHVGPLPGRKSICLYVMEYPPGGGAVMRTLAFFRNEQDAAQALQFLDAAVRGRPGAVA